MQLSWSSPSFATVVGCLCALTSLAGCSDSSNPGGAGAAPADASPDVDQAGPADGGPADGGPADGSPEASAPEAASPQCPSQFACPNSVGLLMCDRATQICVQSGCAGGLGGASSYCQPVPRTGCGPCPTCECLGYDGGCDLDDAGAVTIANITPLGTDSCVP
jgi:hypothetical protein